MRSQPEPADLAPDPVDYAISVDLAQGGVDWTALSVVERWQRWQSPAAWVPEHRVTHLERWRDARTALVPQRVAAVDQQIRRVFRDRWVERQLHVDGHASGTPPRPTVDVLVDRTGVGPFGLDPLRSAGFFPIGVTIHGGDAVTGDRSEGFRVPKRDLAGAVGVALQSGRLLVGEALPLAAVLRGELENFRVKISLAGHDSYGAGEDWREGNHDDLVLSVAMAVWWGEVRAAQGALERVPDEFAKELAALLNGDRAY